MRNNWLFFDLDGRYIYPPNSHLLHGFGGRLWSHLGSLVDDSLHNPLYFNIPMSGALQEAFSCISKFAGALLIWFSRGSISSNPRGSKPRKCLSCAEVKHPTSYKGNLTGWQFNSTEHVAPVFFGKIASATIKHLRNEVEHLQSFPMFSLAAALVPPFDKLRSSKVLAIPLENIDVNGKMDQAQCGEEHQGCASLSLSSINWARTTDAVEPRTGIKFPTVLDNFLAADNYSGHPSEVLVGTGFKSMKIIKVRTLTVYAFGLYIHPGSVCKKLSSKYASVPINELKNRDDFFEDLLREDIHMTVRLVVNCRGLKINTVRDVFERSLRNRLLKTNPNTDYECLRTFGSYFARDIPLPVGTTIDFRQTTDGQLITEVGGKRIGAVHSKELCRAFFDMYIGNIPVSVQTKQEIGRNVAGIIKQC